jgi:hypothetical protein
MQNRAARFGPAAITSTGAVLLNSLLTSNAGPTGFSSPQAAASSATLAGILAVYIILTHIRIVNTTVAAITASLFINGTSVAASASANAFAFNAYSIAANSYVDWYGRVRLDPSDWLVGYASAANLTWQGEGEIGLL